MSTFLKLAALVVAAVLLAACHRGASRSNLVQASNIPSSFDVTVYAEKDTQFDLDDAPLTAQDLQSAFRYRLEQNLPMTTVLLKRSEKQKVKNEHLVALARIATQMKIKAYVEESGGEIAEIQAPTRDSGETEPAKPDSK
ncbi:MAG TPA: hypothetical protein VGC30_01170 [Dokdonella sp.]